LTREGFCTTSELAEHLSVSEMTVRRDVARLSRTLFVRRVHGGVTVLPGAATVPTDFAERSVLMHDEKLAIARRASKLLQPGATIGIDSGTTTLLVAQQLPTGNSFTVASHSLPVLVALSNQSHKHTRLIALGGELHPETQDFAGPATWEAIASLRLSVTLLAAGGLNERGVFCASYHEALVKRHLIDVSDHVVLLADSSKFSSSAMIRVCALEDIDAIVVDRGITKEQEKLLISSGVDVIVASSTSTGGAGDGQSRVTQSPRLRTRASRDTQRS
jgi:DeoR/GlpR family transcriptional regulator of sugar metabolism